MRFCFTHVEQIKRFQEDPKKMNLTPAQQPPDGQPIGMDWWSRADDDCSYRWTQIRQIETDFGNPYYNPF